MALGRHGAFHGGSQPTGRLECWVTTSGGTSSGPSTRGRYSTSSGPLTQGRYIVSVSEPSSLFPISFLIASCCCCCSCCPSCPPLVLLLSSSCPPLPFFTAPALPNQQTQQTPHNSLVATSLRPSQSAPPILLTLYSTRPVPCLPPSAPQLAQAPTFPSPPEPAPRQSASRHLAVLHSCTPPSPHTIQHLSSQQATKPPHHHTTCDHLGHLRHIRAQLQYRHRRASAARRHEHQPTSRCIHPPR